ncbi:hypothetical protein EMIHUDRAFT_224837 [Emiliania huxleyi CCMP1516]|uniref:Rhodanese domain-containing protein n=2 Tax=Emiliania huxleyi TaxID=2903 RepID=A0A0D3KQ44_EMIH1|nr:hypothetical protein EMIHUDRAFT_224837 [Emiliania huxleyi CCMP1516]EOD37879.1 hypothetical protein EMIHUDRAFT_224837 [Emiliania huxleyi CCMP1516]|eukprot:XP_005790308.1 hypothetical protein EMIHUDRAFT_224837 [Emiliania huxleyi CCMP1516]
MLPTACDTPMVVHCKSGKRANEAISYLAAQGYTRQTAQELSYHCLAAPRIYA